MISLAACEKWFALAFLGMVVLAQGAIQPDDLLKKADERRAPSGEFSFSVKVEDFKGKTRLNETTYRVYAKDGKRTRVETTEPARLSGRKLLMRDNDLWLFLPDVKRPTRVSLQQRLTGEVSNGDIARTAFHEDYSPKVVGEAKVGKLACYKLVLTARNEDTTYRKIHLWVQKLNFRPVQADFFAISGKRLKRSTYSAFKPILGVPRSSRVEIRDALKPSRFSRLSYSAFKREKLDDSFFTKESLP